MSKSNALLCDIHVRSRHDFKPAIHAIKFLAFASPISWFMPQMAGRKQQGTGKSAAPSRCRMHMRLPSRNWLILVSHHLLTLLYEVYSLSDLIFHIYLFSLL